MCFHVKFLSFQWASDVVHHKDSIISPQIDLCILYALICTGQNKKMSATQHALQFAFATVAVHTRCQLEDRLGWLLSVQIHALSFSLWFSSKKLPRGDQVACSLNWNAICHNSQGCNVTSKQWGFAKDKRTVPTILIPCTFPVLTLNGSLFSFSVTQVTTVNILYISFRQKLYHIYKTVSLDYLYETLIQSRAGDHIHFSNVPRLRC